MNQWKRWLPLLGLILVLALASCSAASAPAAPVIEAPAADAVSLQELPQNVDIDTVYEIQNDPDVFMLDVREQEEYDEKHIPGTNLIPMSTIQNRLDEIPTDKTVIVTCRSGNRSDQVTQFLRTNGFDNTHNMTGGINAWQEAGYPVEQ
jgi:rhodanese-related sulfurtransferase